MNIKYEHNEICLSYYLHIYLSDTWEQCPAQNFRLRVGPNYSKKGLKDKSPDALMELVGIE